jgi:hypothetical protein
MSELRLFLPITKIDEEKRLVYGVLTQECRRDFRLCEREARSAGVV